MYFKFKFKRVSALLVLLLLHYDMINCLLTNFIFEIIEYSSHLQMDAKNLAIMFGPTLIRKMEDDTASLVTDMSDQCRIIETIILHVCMSILFIFLFKE